MILVIVVGSLLEFVCVMVVVGLKNILVVVSWVLYFFRLVFDVLVIVVRVFLLFVVIRVIILYYVFVMVMLKVGLFVSVLVFMIIRFRILFGIFVLLNSMLVFGDELMILDINGFYVMIVLILLVE